MPNERQRAARTKVDSRVVDGRTLQPDICVARACALSRAPTRGLERPRLAAWLQRRTCVQQLVDVLLGLVHDVQDLHKVTCARARAGRRRRVSDSTAVGARLPARAAAGVAATGGADPRRRSAPWTRSGARPRPPSACARASPTEPRGPESARALLPNLLQVPVQRRVGALRATKRARGRHASHAAQAVRHAQSRTKRARTGVS